MHVVMRRRLWVVLSGSCQQEQPQTVDFNSYECLIKVLPYILLTLSTVVTFVQGWWTYLSDVRSDVVLSSTTGGVSRVVLSTTSTVQLRICFYMRYLLSDLPRQSDGYTCRIRTGGVSDESVVLSTITGYDIRYYSLIPSNEDLLFWTSPCRRFDFMAVIGSLIQGKIQRRNNKAT